MEGQMLTILAPRLGVNADNIIRKANELLDLTAIRSGSSSLAALNVSGSCKSVMCLELAALTFNQTIDRKTAITVCGMPKKIYNSAFKALQCLLDLQPKVSIADLTVQFGCPNIRGFALEILKRYKDSQFGSDTAEYSQGLFNCAAVYSACRKMKTKAAKSKFVETAGCKKNAFDRLVAEMDKHADHILSTSNASRVTKGKISRDFVNEIEAKCNADIAASNSGRNDEGDEQTEPYEEWKCRILTEAYAKLGKTYIPKS